METDDAAKVELRKHVAQAAQQVNLAECMADSKRDDAEKVEVRKQETELKAALQLENEGAEASLRAKQEPEINTDRCWFCKSKQPSLEQWPCGHGQLCNLCIQEHKVFFTRNGQEHNSVWLKPICPTCKEDVPTAASMSFAVAAGTAGLETPLYGPWTQLIREADADGLRGLVTQISSVQALLELLLLTRAEMMQRVDAMEAVLSRPEPTSSYRPELRALLEQATRLWDIRRALLDRLKILRDEEGAAADIDPEVGTVPVDNGRVSQSTQLGHSTAGSKWSSEAATRLERLVAAAIKRQRICIRDAFMFTEEEEAAATTSNNSHCQEGHSRPAGRTPDPTTLDFSYPWTTLLELERLIWIACGREPSSFQSEILGTRLVHWNQLARNYCPSPFSPGYYDDHARKLKRLYAQELDIVASLCTRLAAEARISLNDDGEVSGLKGF